jgi:transposase
VYLEGDMFPINVSLHNIYTAPHPRRRHSSDLSNFERGQIIGARLSGASVNKTVTLLGVSRATVSKVMSAYTNHRMTTPAKKNSGRKTTLTVRDRHTVRRIVSKNYRTTTAHMIGRHK